MGQKSLVTPLKFLKQNWIQSLILLVIPFALYFQVISHDYILDDRIVLSENTFVLKGVKGIPDILKYDSFYGYFQQQVDVLEGGRYRPLSLVTFAIEYEFLGLNPAVSHVINLLLYGFIGVLIFLMFTWFQQRFKLGGNAWFNLGFIGALLFLFHPIHTEGVINIKSRDEILALLLALASLISIVYAYFMSKKTSWIWYLLGGIFFFLGMLAKENAITFALVIPATIYFLEKEKKYKSLIAPTVVLAVISAIYLYARHSVIGGTVSASQVQNPLNNPFHGFTDVQVWGTILYTFEKYIELLLVPLNLSHDYYPYAIPVADFSFARVWLAIIGYGAMGVYAIYGLFKRSIPAFAALYYLATFSVVSNVFVVIGTTMNERFIFMSSLAFSLVTAYFIVRLHKWQRYLAIGTFVALLAFYAYGTIVRCPDWGSYINLNKSAVEHAPNSARSNLFYGTALFREVAYAPASKEKEEMLRKSLNHFIKAQEIFVNYGTPTSKFFMYADAVNMRSGAAAELYKMNAMNQKELLHHFKEVLKKNPRNDFTRQFLEFLNRNGAGNTELINFYKDVISTVLIPYAQQVNASYYNNAMQYTNLALNIAPGDSFLIQKQAEISAALGRR